MPRKPSQRRGSKRNASKGRSSRGRGGRRARRVGLSGILLFLFLALVCTAAIYWASRLFLAPGGDGTGVGPPPAATAGGAESGTGTAGTEPGQRPETEGGERPYEDFDRIPAPDRRQVPPPEPARGARVALVIDDLGRSLEDVRALGRLGVPVTYAVLPFETRTPEVVAALARQGREILLHLPMEPKNGADPGPGALTGAMSERQLERSTLDALEAVPGAVGVNNHMGSGLSADRRAMRAVLGVLAERGLFFLDSRTTAETVAYREATALGMPAAERQVFLDREVEEGEITRQFHRLLAEARERGSAIAIGHPYPETLAVLRREVPRAVGLGYEFVPVSFLLQRSGGLPE